MNDEVIQLRRRMEDLEHRNRDLEAILKQNNSALLGAFHLPPNLTNLLGLLLAVPVVTPEMVRERLGIASEAKMAVYRLRQALKPWDVKVVCGRQVGWWIEPADKKRIEAVLDGTAARKAA